MCLQILIILWNYCHLKVRFIRLVYVIVDSILPFFFFFCICDKLQVSNEYLSARD